MASSNKTRNLKLNQWDASDPVLRTDFNQDNQKLDEVLGGLAGQKIADVTTTTETTQVDVNISRSFDEFCELKMFVYDYANASGGVIQRSDGIIRLGGRTSKYYHGPTFGNTTETDYLAKFTIPANYDRSSLLVLTIQPGVGLYTEQKIVRCTWESYYNDYYQLFTASQGYGTHITNDLIGLTKINLYNLSPNYNFRTGMRIVIFGTPV